MQLVSQFVCKIYQQHVHLHLNEDNPLDQVTSARKLQVNAVSIH